MPITNTIVLVPVSSILVERSTRQRSILPADHIKALGESIAGCGVGLINPIIVEKATMTLCAGECRLSAFQWLATSGLACMIPGYDNWQKIPVRFATNASSFDLTQIELEENTVRRDLDWKDYVQAVGRYHDARSAAAAEEGKPWTVHSSTAALHLSGAQAMRNILEVYRNLDNKLVQQCTSLTSAVNVCARGRERSIAALLTQIDPAAQIAGEQPILPAALAPTTVDVQVSVPPTLKVKPQEESANILCADFFTWAKSYSGPSFNLLHCDFPYGINIDSSDQRNFRRLESQYDDSFETYSRLLDHLCALPTSILCWQSHMVFWLSFKHLSYTTSRLQEAGWSVDPFPLVWIKSDNAGILPDAMRGPRRIYETALFCTRGDIPIVKAVSNAYSGPTATNEHGSCKPYPMLRHFLSMLIDKSTRLLDPTCGSGTSIRAAESLGAGYALGLEVNPPVAEHALSALRADRAKRQLLPTPSIRT